MQPGKTPGQEALQRLQNLQQQQIQLQRDNMKKAWWWKRKKEEEEERLRQIAVQAAGENIKSRETKNFPHNYEVLEEPKLKSRWFIGSLVFLVGVGLSFSFATAGRKGNPLILLVGLVITIIISRKVWRKKKK